MYIHKTSAKLKIPGQTLPQKELREVGKSTEKDLLIERLLIAAIDNTKPNNGFSKEDLTMKTHYENKRGILFRKVQDEDKEIEQLVFQKS